jgi:hypothetical protein
VSSPRTNPAGPPTPRKPTTHCPRLARLGRYLRHQLDPERSLGLLAPPARRANLGGDLGPDVIPERPATRRGERLDLDLALPVPDRHPGPVLLGHDQLDLVLGPDRHLQAAEVHPLEVGEGLLRVPRAALRTRDSRGLLRLVVIELVAVRVF